MERTFEIRPNYTISKLEIYYDVLMKKNDGSIVVLGTVSSFCDAEKLVKELEKIW